METADPGAGMMSILPAALDCVVGATEVEREGSSVTFHRVPGEGRSRLRDPFLDWVSSVPSGVRMEARTDATVLELVVDIQHLVFPDMQPPSATFDLVIDGVRQEPVRAKGPMVLFDPETSSTDVRSAGPTTLRFDLGAAVERRVDIWFPASAVVNLLDVRIPDRAGLRPAACTGPLWTHHGSSISQCGEADRPTETWPAIVARAAGLSLTNLATAGQCHLDQFMARAIRDRPADVISLELGINVVNADSMRERTFVSAFHGFLDTIRDGHPDVPLVIVTPIACPVAEDHPGPTVVTGDKGIGVVPRPPDLGAGALSLRRIRELLRQHVGVRRAEGDAALSIVEGPELFGPEDVHLLPDGLHPNAEGYRLMGDRFHALRPFEEGRDAVRSRMPDRQRVPSIEVSEPSDSGTSA